MLNMKALIHEVTCEITTLLSQPKSWEFSGIRQSFYWVKAESGGVGKEFLLPNWSAIHYEIDQFLSRHPNVIELSNELGRKINTPTSGGMKHYDFRSLLIRMFLATGYQLTTIPEASEALQMYLTNFFINNIQEIQVYSPICKVPTLEDEIALDQNVSLVPATKPLIGYLNGLQSQFESYGHGKRLDMLTLNQPVMRLKFIVTPPTQYSSNYHAIEARTKTELAIALSVQRKAHAVMTETAPITLAAHGSEGTSGPTPFALHQPFSLKQLSTLRKVWHLLKEIPTAELFDNAKGKNRLVLAIQRYYQAVAEPEPDIYIDLMTSLEIILGTGGKDELKFRYSAMAAALLGATHADRKIIFDDFKEAYDQRSIAVHGAISKATKRDAQHLDRLRQYISEIMIRALQWHALGRSFQTFSKSIESSLIEGRLIEKGSLPFERE